MVAHTGFDVARRMQKVGEATIKAQKIAMRDAAVAAKAVHVAGLMADTSGGRLRNVGKKGAKLSVRYRMVGEGARVYAIVEASGSAWPILNNPAKAHEIRSRKGRVLKFGDTFRRTVHHPGHRGKRTWQKAEPEAMAVASKALNRTMVIAVQQAFKS